MNILDMIRGWFTPTINIRYIRSDLETLKFIEDNKSDWIDLRAGCTVKLYEMECASIPLGIAMQLPRNCEAHIQARSSTYKNYGIIMVNSGVIDNSYCGNDDEWHLEVLALRDTVIRKNDRICQFRIIKRQPRLKFNTVNFLNNPNRGGLGTTGKR